MNDAATIRKMIAEVSLHDWPTLYEIDVRVLAWHTGYKVLKIVPTDGDEIGYLKFNHRWLPEGATRTKFIDGQLDFIRSRELTRRFTISRDAVRSIRPQGWQFHCGPDYCKAVGPIEITVENMAREVLAELDAIIRATEYDRKQQAEAAEASSVTDQKV